MQVSFGASIIAVLAYVIGSLLTCKKGFNMDRMLHRGEYAKITEAVGGVRDQELSAKRSLFARLIGIDRNFTKGDKVIATGLFGWGMLWFGVLVIGSIWNLISPWSVEVWKQFWHVAGVGIPVVMTLVTAVWFTWGGTRDVIRLFARLKQEKINALDDGTVVGHQNLDEAAITHEPDGAI
jgi:SSS family solute:Na+ symporter